MRSFVALLLSEAARESVAEEIERLRPLCRAVAWVPRENLHFTLRFLGEQTPNRIEEAIRALEKAAASDAFSLELSGLGAFPGLDRPRILWVGVGEGSASARALQGRVAAVLEAHGFGREERPWHPHLTIGRVFDQRRWRREAGAAFSRAVTAAAAKRFGSVAVDTIALMRSEISRAGARYTELGSVPLLGARTPLADRDHPTP
jgi:2'-5' RNA ligase